MIKLAIRFLVWVGTRFDHTYGRHAYLVGAGPCERCVGQSVSGPISETGSEHD